MKKLMFLAVAAILVITGCQQDAASNWSTLNLLDKGFPISVQAPDSVEVKVNSDLSFLQDITLDSPEDNYHIQIYASTASTDDIALIKADLVSDVRSNPFFSKVVEEDESGFVYEMMIDSANYYSFRHVHVKGDKEFIFQPGLANTFSLEEVQRLKKAVKQGGEQ